LCAGDIHHCGLHHNHGKLQIQHCQPLLGCCRDVDSCHSYLHRHSQGTLCAVQHGGVPHCRSTILHMVLRSLHRQKQTNEQAAPIPHRLQSSMCASRSRTAEPASRQSSCNSWNKHLRTACA
jgi:hypothetical protein